MAYASETTPLLTPTTSGTEELTKPEHFINAWQILSTQLCTDFGEEHSAHVIAKRAHTFFETNAELIDMDNKSFTADATLLAFAENNMELLKRALRISCLGTFLHLLATTSDTTSFRVRIDLARSVLATASSISKPGSVIDASPDLRNLFAQSVLFLSKDIERDMPPAAGAAAANPSNSR